MGHGTVRLKIRLIHHIDSQLIAHFQQVRIRRIVGCPYRVDIIFLTQFHITLDLLGSQRIAVLTAGVMVIHPMQLYFMVIQIENRVFDHNILKANPRFHTTACNLIIQVIQYRLLGIPLCHIQVLEHGLRYLIPGNNRSSLTDSVSFQSKGDFSVRIQLHAGRCPIAVPCLLRLKTDIPDIAVITDPQQYITEDPVVAEHILTFQIGSVTPSVHHCRQLIFSLMDIR